MVCMTEQNDRPTIDRDMAQRGGVTTYFEGKPAVVGQENREIDDRIKELIKAREEGKEVTVFFDVDGCLIEAGLETAGNSKTLEQWVAENEDKIKSFKNNIDRLTEAGFKFGLSTGRGEEFAKRLINAIFPEGEIGKSIVEGGLLIYDHNTDSYEVAPAVDQESAKVLQENREKIMNLAMEHGGVIEGGKLLSVSINPPADSEGNRNTDNFRDKMIEELGPELASQLVITNSSTAVDITPKGVDKLTALNDLTGDEMVVYVGDGKNDQTAMSGSEVNLAPGNSHNDIKEYVKTSNKIGLLASSNDLEGITKMLRLIAAAEKVYRGKK